MDLTQSKLTKAEWEGIEVPEAPQEKTVLKMIRNGFHNVNFKTNPNQSILSFAKLDDSPTMQNHIFIQYLKPVLEKLYKKYGVDLAIAKINAKLVPKKRDIIRLGNIESTISKNKSGLYEFTVLNLIDQMLSYLTKGKEKWQVYYYSLVHLQSISLQINTVLKIEWERFIEHYADQVSLSYYFKHSESTMEKNEVLLQYRDIELYEHQKRIFSTFKQSGQSGQSKPKLVFYVAPTGTGKTLTPIGLAEQYRVIFVCAARHVGLALAKSAISAGRKIALAFNCNDAEDIRLHFAAAKEYTKNYKTGGIYKVDNSVGDNVEIIISDIQSYTVAMLYMKAFNDKENIITYWDEPTITMDYDDHPYHAIIHRNWVENIIPNIVLSSATLPHEDEIRDVLADYRSRFHGDTLSILSVDCNNSIPLISKEGMVTMPHHLPDHSAFSKMRECIAHCQKSSSLIRYMDLTEICKFIIYLNKNGHIKDDRFKMEYYFESSQDITLKTVKNYYLKIFPQIQESDWATIYAHFQKHRHQPYPSNLLVTTKDAYTLTHGPSIYLAKDIEKVAKFYLQQSRIPNEIIETINQTIKKNNKINNDIAKLEMQFENAMARETTKDKKMGDDDRLPPELKQLRQRIENLQLKIESVAMPEVYVPNTPDHFQHWAEQKTTPGNGAIFVPQIPEEQVIKLMQLTDVEPMWKILLLLGIGVFMHHNSIGYVEIMKTLAQEQKLLLILATDDFIYGTNYQFCHGFLGRDLVYLTQEKIIQALGRVGRNKQNKDYSMRMRDNSFISKIFEPLDVKQEAQMMNRLFSI
jgi:hypothetical protein